MPKYSTSRRRKNHQIPVLVIEDNADQWLIIRSVMYQCFPEIEPTWINNADLAVRYLETHAGDATKVPRLVLSNLYLPNREEGLAVLQFIRNHVFCRKPPVIILTSSRVTEDVEMAYALNAASYIVKPGNIHDWIKCFYIFRRYWLEIVTLPLGTA